MRLMPSKFIMPLFARCIILILTLVALPSFAAPGLNFQSSSGGISGICMRTSGSDCDLFHSCCRDQCGDGHHSVCNSPGNMAFAQCVCTGLQGSLATVDHIMGNTVPDPIKLPKWDPPTFAPWIPPTVSPINPTTAFPYSTAPPFYHATATKSTQRPWTGGCGQRSLFGYRDNVDSDESSDVGSRIVGGNLAMLGNWPWQASLQKRGQHRCGASLIDSRHLITAAHCVRDHANPSVYKVALGLTDLNHHGSSSRFVDIQKITVHPNFQRRPFYSHDVAILKLVSPVTFGNSISPVCLPDAEAPSGKECYVTGWGETQVTGYGNGKHLMQTVVPIVPRETCSSPSNWGNLIILDNSMICAGKNGSDSCEGDSGGPLVCQRQDNKWELQGVVSIGHRPCGVANRPGIYVRVTSVKEWILQNLN